MDDFRAIYSNKDNKLCEFVDEMLIIDEGQRP